MLGHQAELAVKFLPNEYKAILRRLYDPIARKHGCFVSIIKPKRNPCSFSLTHHSTELLTNVLRKFYVLMSGKQAN